MNPRSTTKYPSLDTVGVGSWTVLAVTSVLSITS